MYPVLADSKICGFKNIRIRVDGACEEYMRACDSVRQNLCRMEGICVFGG